MPQTGDNIIIQLLIINSQFVSLINIIYVSMMNEFKYVMDK